MFAFDVSIPPAHWVGTEAEAIKWRDYFTYAAKKQGALGLDTETSGRDHNKDFVIVFSLSDGEYRICAPAKFLPLFKDALLENPTVNFDMSNVKFDMHMLANTGINIVKAGELRDTTVQSWLYNENNLGRHGLKDNVKDHLNRETPEFESVFGEVPAKKIDKITGQNTAKTTSDLIYEAFAPYFTPEKVPLLAEEYAKEEIKKRKKNKDHNIPPIEELIKEKLEFIQDRFVRAIDYSALDAYNSTMMRRHWDNLLEHQPFDLKTYFYRTEVPFTKVLYKMERRGITIDIGHLEEQEAPILKDMAVIEHEVAKIAGQPLNLKSNDDLADLFFGKLLKPIKKMTKGGASGIKKPSLDESVLQGWADEGDQVAKMMMKYRTMAKIHGTYIVGLRDRIDQHYRIHTSLNQHGTVTGRLSSKDPNLQNIPRASEDKFKIREAFVPGYRKVLVVADYAQLEMRLMAHFSGDEKMIKAIKDGVDLHCLTVAEMHGIPYDEVIAAVKAEKKSKRGELGRELTEREHELLFMRQAAKATGFGIIYGIGGNKLAQGLTDAAAEAAKSRGLTTYHVTTPEEGFALIDKWFSIFPGVRGYVEYIHSLLKSKGQVQTLVGRFRRFGDVRGMSFKDRGQAERQGVNSVIQGTASDLAKVAMILVEDDPVLNELGAELLLQIHDELILECPDNPDTIKKVKDRVQEIMEAPFQTPLKVPIPAEAGFGYSWATAK